MEIADVVKFLGETTPFDHINAAALSELATKVKVYYFKAQDNVSIDSNRLLIVRTGIFALFSDQQQLLTKLQPGDFYGYQQLLTGLTDNDNLVCEEDGLVY
ncbi:MAG TPA: cyclic nucleotide-binding/CBS domain-containing protein, partial [Rheinheimera sp.]|nr:cyclic nucleotide-binding/CBS domain-containing protein [Rheinheimera sp.]